MKILENLNELVGKTIKSVTHDGKDAVTLQTTDGADYDISVVYDLFGDKELEYVRLNEANKEGEIYPESNLVGFFENNDFNVHLYIQDDKQCAEIETWTDGGVNMLINLESFTIEGFKSYVNDFDIDSQIDLHRESDDYKSDFTLRRSLDDFTAYHNKLKKLVEKLTK